MLGAEIGSSSTRRDNGDSRTLSLVGAGVILAGAGLAWAWSRSRARAHSKDAPGWPGADPRWAPSDKDAVGTALGSGRGGTSLVWFTLGHGALSEVFYPRLHRPCIRDLALVVTDGRAFFSDERCDAEHRVECLEDGTLAYRLINTCKQGRYRIEKTTIASPWQDAVVQQVRFTPLRGALDDYRVYALLNPHMGERREIGSTGWVGRHKGLTMLFAERDRDAMALACSAPWAVCSAGFVGVSDGWTELRRHRRLTRTYERARQGNVLLTGEIDLRACGGEFRLALGFGPEPEEAAHRALASLWDEFAVLQDAYIRGWRDWQAKLRPFGEDVPVDRGFYRTSVAVLRAHEGKTVPGSIVASLSIPWGQERGDGNLGRGGYHVVWPRDLVEVAGGLLAAGAHDEARRALDYLRATQDADGHWPQNMWVGGETLWTSIQLGESALPILLLDLLYRHGALAESELSGYWPMVHRAMRYILAHGPSSQEDRWENERGFTPFTIASLIAALLVASELADRQGETRAGAFLRETADAWHEAINDWTYVEGTELAHQAGVRGYYLRVAPPDERGEPMKYQGHLQFWYRPDIRTRYVPAEIVSSDALAYVRFGLRAHDDPRIVDTLRVIDALLKVDTPYGPSWRRFNFDGYGEQRDGSPFEGQRGQGRAWPLLAGERAHYELAAGRRGEAVRLLGTLEQFASDGGMIPEQVWDSDDIPGHDLYLGRPTGSAMPLAWAHAEYVKLARSLHDGQVFDIPPQTVQRYLVERVRSPHVFWRPDLRRRTMPAGKALRINLRQPAELHWQTDADPDVREAATHDSGLGVHHADLPTERLGPGTRIHFNWTPLERSRENAAHPAMTGWHTIVVE